MGFSWGSYRCGTLKQQLLQRSKIKAGCKNIFSFVALGGNKINILLAAVSQLQNLKKDNSGKLYKLRMIQSDSFVQVPFWDSVRRISYFHAFPTHGGFGGSEEGSFACHSTDGLRCGHFHLPKRKEEYHLRRSWTLWRAFVEMGTFISKYPYL